LYLVSALHGSIGRDRLKKQKATYFLTATRKSSNLYRGKESSIMVRVLVSLTVSYLLLLVGVQASDAEKLVGVWERTGRINLSTGKTIDQYPFRLVITKKHFAFMASEPDRKKLDKPLQDMSKEELLDRLRINGTYGTYTAVGNIFTRHRIYSTNPMREGTKFSQEFSFDGEELILRTETLEGSIIEARFKRLE
jgi:hypothetical protein